MDPNPPISIRLTGRNRAGVEAEAARLDMARNTVINQLIREALAARAANRGEKNDA